MPNGTSTAVTEAARLDEIGFPEFTAKLITDVFDALVSANVRQTDAYLQLVQAVGKSLKDFINDTKDDIGGDEILQFLATVLPPANTDSGEPTKIKAGETLTAGDVTKVNTALKLPTDAGETNNNEVATAGALSQNKVDAIIEAAAKRIANNKYDLFKEMVKQGILRLVVENGTIETRLTFTTYGSSYYNTHKTSYNRKNFNFRSKVKTGGFLSPWVKASASTSYNSVAVRTAKESQRDISGSRVNIFGGVVIKFKTDYLPLSE